MSGDSGEKGVKGVKGSKGARGENGLTVEGEAGDRGQKGEQGEKGVKGIKGFKGATGSKGEAGNQGDTGDKGEPGVTPVGTPLSGSDGEKGDKGAKGQQGRRGDQGRRGPQGDTGEKGDTGLDGEQGRRGDFFTGKCEKGEKGEKGVATQSSDVITIYAKHTQRNDLKAVDGGAPCPPGHDMLWYGYSMLHTEDEGRSHIQDLGKAGSCVEKFDPMPFMTCNGDGVCINSLRNAESYWLSALVYYDDKFKDMLCKEEVRQYISRCAVCVAKGPVIAIHAQGNEVPSCPSSWNGGWKELWNGYSFLMHTEGAMGGGQQLESPGSCLPEYRSYPYIECNADGNCHIFGNKARLV